MTLITPDPASVCERKPLAKPSKAGDENGLVTLAAWYFKSRPVRCVREICLTLAILAVAAGIMLTVTNAHAASPSLALGPQYDTTHVYVAPEEFDRFSDALIATFGGTKSQAAVINITPTPSETMWQAVFTPAGTFSVFGFRTPIPYPFGIERTGYFRL